MLTSVLLSFPRVCLLVTCAIIACFGLTGCRRTVPHLQRMLQHLDDELRGLERAAGVT